MRRTRLASGLIAIAAAAISCGGHTPAAVTPSARPLAELPYTPSLDPAAMDRAADPCVDFYRYTCGGWQRRNPIPGDQESWSVYAKLEHENQQYLWGILEALAAQADGRDAVQQKLGDYFAACMDEGAVETADAAPLAPTLKEIDALASLPGLPTLIARLHRAGAGPLFGFTSSQEFGDATSVIAFAMAGGLGLPDRDYYFRTDPDSIEARKRYVAHVQKMLGLLGDAPDAAAAEAQTVMAIETALAEASLTLVDKRDPHKLDHKMGRAELQAVTPSFDWGAYLAAAGVPDVEALNVTEPAFFARLEAELKGRALAAWKTYLRWQAVHAAAPYLSKRFVDADFEFYYAYLNGVAEQQPRWKKCVQWVDRDLGEALGQEFVRRTFTPETKARAVDMTARIEEAMRREIEALPWMGAETKQKALAKLAAIRNKVGYPDAWRDYSALEIGRDGFFGDVERAVAFETARQLAKIGRPLDRGEWFMTPPTVNAYFDPQLNDINFPAGVLQPPLFDPKLDDAPNYGNTGSTIGHELTHGFDDEGRQFDASGNLADWWTPGDAAEFVRRTSCVQEQYGQYVVVDDIRINSALSLGEDVADLGGTLLAYLAWKDATKDQKLEARDDLTPDQRFFVGMAQWACSNERPESLRQRALTDPHSPDKYRVNGVVANMPEFAQAFGCKPGQPMAREHVCRVW